MPEDTSASNNFADHPGGDLSRFLPEGRSLDDFPADLVEEQKSILFSPKEIIAKFFEVTEELGFGTVGAVYRVKDHLMHGQEKALKVILPSLIRGRAAEERFINGAQIAQSLRHEGIVTVYDIREDRGRDTLFFTMEFLRGDNLAAHLQSRGGRLEFPEACGIVLQVCDALTYAHGKGVIHRDIKPQNIFILPGGRVKVLDFGFAKLLSPARLSCTSIGFGTAYYMAPEQSTGSAIDERTDIFSLGAVFYQMLTGMVPMGIFQFPSEINKDLPTSINSVIKRCLNQNPDDRYRDTAALADDIRNIRNDMKSGSVKRVSRRKKETKPPEEREPRGRKAAVMALVVIAVALIGTLYLWTTGDDAPAPQGPSDPVPPAAVSEAGSLTPEFTPSVPEIAVSQLPETDQPADAGEEEREEREEEYASLLAKADEQIRVRKYTLPKDDNAFSTLQEILKRDPGNRQAAQKLKEIRDIYVNKADVALKKGNYSRAQRFYRRTLRVSPGDEEAERGLMMVMAEKEGQSEKNGQLAGEMVFVTGGCFQMGDTFGDGESDEKPVHTVCVNDYFIGMHEVTQGMWKDVMGSNPSGFKECGSECPVEHVSYDEVQVFIRKLRQRTGGNYRLPTEAEWEFACRSGGGKEKYSGGSDPGSTAWHDANSGDRTHPWGEKAPNGLGIYDMSGSVWEWVADRYDKDFYARSPEKNPAGPQNGIYRVKRGGGWSHGPDEVRCSYRAFGRPDYRYGGDGFRLLMTK